MPVIKMAVYPFILHISQMIGLTINQIYYLQLLFFSIALAYLLYYLLYFRKPFIMVMIFFIAITINFYIARFHFALITESFSFSVICLFLANWLKYFHSHKIKDLIWTGIFVGLLLTIRLAFLPFLVGIICSTCLLKISLTAPYPWRDTVKKTLLGVILPVLAMQLLENAIFFSYHDKRSSNIVRDHSYGRAFTFILLKDFSPDNVSPPIKPIITQAQQEFSAVTTWYQNLKINGINQTCAKLRFYGMIEDFSYTGNRKFLNEAFRELVKKSDATSHIVQKSVGISTLLKNPDLWLRSSIIHYFGSFCLGVAGNFPQYYDAEILSALFPNFNPPKYPIILYYAFVALGMALFFVTLFYGGLFIWVCIGKFYQKLPAKFKAPSLAKNEIFAMHLLLWIQGYQIFTSLTATFTPRYLMISYPMTILALLLIGFAWIKRLHKR
ncbi:MAG: hypothetical protein K0U45_04950 [Alphaproteobacteria bacterium]|nr:hypothetical protein [Alphaproteobacteria bacterium]